jgi:predicted DNA-binding transcriptional regulator YafY
MYSPTTRLLTVLELLQSYKQMTGAELARRLEVDVRSIRRYIVMLQDMGIPIEAERGPYGAYQLMRGYKLPPLMFTDTEAVAVTLGLLAIRAYGFPVNIAAVEGALAKTERVLPDKLHQQTRALQEAITFRILPPPPQPKNDHVAELSSAVLQSQTILLSYRAWNGEETQRNFDPYGIVLNDGFWYVSGYCHLRQDLRTFRLDRIVKLESTQGSFEPPQDFDPLAHVLDSLASTPGSYRFEVLLKTSLEQAQRIISPDEGTLEETPDGVLYRRDTDRLEWMAHFLIRLDFPISVLQPPELPAVLREIASKALQIAGEAA